MTQPSSIQVPAEWFCFWVFMAFGLGVIVGSVMR